jgi:AAA domain/Bifunctional DNA primase/polymerase, N-terminal
LNTFEVRDALHRMGYSPVACHGKRPLAEKWQTRLRATAEDLAKDTGANTGVIACYNPGFDIDILDPAAADTAERVFKDWLDGRGTIPVRIGQWPKRAIALRTPEPFQKIQQHYRAPNGTTHKIEVLCNGQQYLAHGVHPDTKKDYEWVGPPLWEIPHDDLVEVREAEMREFVSYLSDVLRDEHKFEAIDPPKSNGAAHPSDDEMRPGNINNAQWNRSGDRIRAGDPIDDIVRDLMEETEKASEPGWNWAKEERQIRGMLYRRVNEDPTLAHTLPEKLWLQWQAIVARGGIPQVSVKGAGFRVLDENGEPAAEAKQEAPQSDVPALPAGWVRLDLSTAVPTAWLIKGLLPETGVLILPGQWGLYKTTGLLQFSHCLMTGNAFAGHYRVKKPGGVAMYALEGAGSIVNRLKAVAQFAGDESPTFPFYQVPQCPPLSSPDAAPRIIADLKRVSKVSEHEFGMPIRVAWFDTYSAAAGHTGSGDDNDRAATQKVFNALRRISHETGILVAVVDHYGKVIEAGTTGSSGKEGNADTVLANLGDREVSGATDNLRMVVRKQRDGQSGFEIPFEPVTIEVGTDEDGDAITAVALSFGEARAAKMSRKLSTNDILFRRAFEEASRNQGFQFVRDTGDTVPAVYEEYVRDVFYEMYPRGDGTDQQYRNRRATVFARAVKTDISSGYLTRQDSDDGGVLFRAREGNA